ncbi:ACT domain-containing protein isoform 1 [Dorcoceras hygrometricum]|uniref:ACT domain-containing protein ACR n=1 Tax=Dorcoceras hygrometricum TaxID=472368 RepID=A0A2Z7DE08_9LAMI|nr:ACT domain-containing protein isoform 1 [Dorcoceras hygrometricum]
MAMANAYITSSFTSLRFRPSHSVPDRCWPTSKSNLYFWVSPRIDSTRNKNVMICASVDGVDSVSSSSFSLKSGPDTDYVPMPIVLIDQDTDPDATIVQLSFGDRLGALLDTMKALKDLGLDVLKGTVTTENSVTQTKFFITRLSTGRKVEDPDVLERIRLTIINNLLKYHPESSERLALGEAFGIKAPDKSLLTVETADRSGLLLEIIKIMSDINVTVESAEIDTEGLVAKDKFHVSYRGAALNSSLSQVIKFIALTYWCCCMRGLARLHNKLIWQLESVILAKTRMDASNFSRTTNRIDSHIHQLVGRRCQCDVLDLVESSIL